MKNFYCYKILQLLQFEKELKENELKKKLFTYTVVEV